jgi:hypothetical protein
MKRFLPLIFTGLILSLFAIADQRTPVQATGCSVAHVFATGEQLTAANLNANPNGFIVCLSNIDQSNVGSAGFYASQIKPTTTAQATFGGSVQYKFTTSPLGPSGFPLVAPIYDNAGTLQAHNFHQVVTSCTVPSSGSGCSVTLFSSSAFTSSSTYWCSASVLSAGTVGAEVQNNNGSQVSAIVTGGQPFSQQIQIACLGY